MSPRMVAGALGVLALAIVVYGSTGLLRVWQMKQEVEALEREIVTLRGEAHDLERAADQLRNDPGAVEKIAREEYGFVRAGDKVLKFPPTPGGR